MTTTTQDQDQCRAEFEAWANGILALAYEREKGRYVDGYSETCFQCWQAARRTQPPACAADDGWQPIETAPKDGRVLWLGYYNAHGNWRTLRGEWVSADQIAECWEEEAEPGWYETAVEAEDPPNAWATSPTHWRPLPKPPTDKGAPDA